MHVSKTPLLFAYFEACHYNSSFPTKIPLNTYGHSLGLAVGVYEDLYFISLSLTCGPHMSSSSSSPHLSLRLSLSLHPDATTEGAAGGGGCGLAGEPTSHCRDPARRGRAAGDGSATAEQQDAADAELTAQAAGAELAA